MCDFTPVVTDATKIMKTVIALAACDEFSLTEKGVLVFDRGMFKTDATVNLHELPGKRFDDEQMMRLLLNCTLRVDDVKLLGTGVSIGLGEIYLDNELIFKISLCDKAHDVRLDTPHGDALKPYATALSAARLIARLIKADFITETYSVVEHEYRNLILSCTSGTVDKRLLQQAVIDCINGKEYKDIVRFAIFAANEKITADGDFYVNGYLLSDEIIKLVGSKI